MAENSFGNEERERLVRVEEAVNFIKGYIQEYVPKFQEAEKDIISLKTTQKWARYVFKTTLGAAILAFVGFIVKGVVYLATKLS